MKNKKSREREEVEDGDDDGGDFQLRIASLSTLSHMSLSR